MAIANNIIRFIFVIISGVFLLSISSCSHSDEPECIQSAEVNLTFRIEIEGQNPLTRAKFAAYASPDILQWSVYEVETDDAGEVTTRTHLEDVTDESFFSSGAGFVLMKLAKGRKYQVAFFAKNKQNEMVTFAQGKMHINYSDQEKSISNNLSAFTCLSPVITSRDSEIPIVLKRQLSAIRWYCRHLSYSVFSNDSEAKGIKYDLKIVGPVYKCYNVLTQTCEEEVKVIEYKNRNVFNVSTIGTTDKTTVVDEVFYLVCYNFILTDAVSKSGTVNMELTFYHDKIEDYNSSFGFRI